MQWCAQLPCTCEAVKLCPAVQLFLLSDVINSEYLPNVFFCRKSVMVGNFCLHLYTGPWPSEFRIVS